MKSGAAIFIFVIYWPLFCSGQKATLPKGCPKVTWATWGSFTGKSAVASISSKGKSVGLNMKTNFSFAAARIFRHEVFNNFQSPIPNTAVPRTSWSASPSSNGIITMCFSETVKNPVLMIASLGGETTERVALNFSVPYVVLYQTGRLQLSSNTSMVGHEGNAVIMFPGDFNCLTIRSSDYEKSYITWGIPECVDPPVKPVPPVTVPVPKPIANIPSPSPPKPAAKILATKPPEKVIIKPNPVKASASVLQPPATLSGTRITVWDFDCVDFDSISITLNGKQKALKPYSFTDLNVFMPCLNLPMYWICKPETTRSKYTPLMKVLTRTIQSVSL